MPSPKALANLKDTYKDEQPLLPELQRHILKKVQQDENTRRTDIIHPSAMSSNEWCPRHDYYGIIGAEKSTPKGGATTFRRELIYEYGHSVHRKYQTWLWEMGLLWGKWKCHQCGYEWMGLAPEFCFMCKCVGRITYEEVPFDLKDTHHLGGHADGLVMQDQNRLIEIKTTSVQGCRFDAPRLYQQYEDQHLTHEQLWYRIKRPFGKHLRQGLIYIAEARLMYPELDVNEIIFIYEWKPNSDTKSFLVKYMPNVVDPLMEKVQQVHEAATLFETEGSVDPPPRPEWAEAADGKVCKSCDYRGTCWGIDPAEETGAETTAVRVRRSAKKRRPKT